MRGSFSLLTAPALWPLAGGIPGPRRRGELRRYWLVLNDDRAGRRRGAGPSAAAAPGPEPAARGIHTYCSVYGLLYVLKYEYCIYTQLHIY